MKRMIAAASAVMILAALSFSAAAVSADSAGAAILIHADTGEVLYEKNSTGRMLIASTTKIMTALVVLEDCSPDEMVTVPDECAGIEGSSMYLEPGDRRTVRELLYGMLLVSGNDAAAALAVHTAGSIEAFAALMNEKAGELQLVNSHFANPHGLDADGHYGCAADLALITREAMRSPVFREIFGTKTADVGGQTLINHNRLLWDYEGCTGGKTGYTMAAGRSLVTCAERDGMRLICVTISDPDDWNTHRRLYDWAFSTYCCEPVYPLLREMPVPLISGLAESVDVGCESELFVLRRRDEQYVCRIELPRFVYAPVKKGDAVGRLTVRADGREIGSVDLVALEDAPLDESLRLTAWERFRTMWYRINGVGSYFPGI